MDDKPVLDTGVVLPSGGKLYVKETEVKGLRLYYTDEVGGGAMIWSTMIDPYTLLAAISYEENLRRMELREEKQKQIALVQ